MEISITPEALALALRWSERVLIALLGFLFVYFGYKLVALFPNTRIDVGIEIKSGYIKARRLTPPTLLFILGAWILVNSIITPVDIKTQYINEQISTTTNEATPIAANETKTPTAGIETNSAPNRETNPTSNRETNITVNNETNLGFSRGTNLTVSGEANLTFNGEKKPTSNVVTNSTSTTSKNSTSNKTTSSTADASKNPTANETTNSTVNTSKKSTSNVSKKSTSIRYFAQDSNRMRHTIATLNTAIKLAQTDPEDKKYKGYMKDFANSKESIEKDRDELFRMVFGDTKLEIWKIHSKQYRENITDGISDADQEILEEMLKCFDADLTKYQ